MQIQHKIQVLFVYHVLTYQVQRPRPTFSHSLSGGYLPDISCCPGEKPAQGCYAGNKCYEYNVGKAIKGGGYDEKDREVRKDIQRCTPTTPGYFNKLQYRDKVQGWLG